MILLRGFELQLVGFSEWTWSGFQMGTHLKNAKKQPKLVGDRTSIWVQSMDVTKSKPCAFPRNFAGGWTHCSFEKDLVYTWWIHQACLPKAKSQFSSHWDQHILLTFAKKSIQVWFVNCWFPWPTKSTICEVERSAMFGKHPYRLQERYKYAAIVVWLYSGNLYMCSVYIYNYMSSIYNHAKRTQIRAGQHCLHPSWTKVGWLLHYHEIYLQSNGTVPTVTERMTESLDLKIDGNRDGAYQMVRLTL